MESGGGLASGKTMLIVYALCTILLMELLR